ncbi:RNA polymerase subunit sigma-24 [Hylemonella gracilis str. Niagara R]|uniref:RNA polymerase subunit sigma-24 n=1 Tax=Hylemonella gracilis str. Niagara R TaxID=1458275 RepID=A0A016XH28_9BURK|nr:RNA polymerase sigma factor [Hylemonella gracilis]EYC51404.1 RNA polymerase subunit sigma-24 [Hylemonella gracilis str. Niagara R]
MDRRPLVEQIPALRRYARALTGEAWAADDLVQDTLERACVKWRLWLAGSDLRAWLFSIMHNLHVDQVRRRVRQGGLNDASDWSELDLEPAAPETTIDGALDMQRCLLRLPPEQRETLLLVTLEDLSYAEVARITRVPVGTVMSRLSRARHRLQALLDGAPTSAGPAVPPAMPGSATELPSPSPLRRLK